VNPRVLGKETNVKRFAGAIVLMLVLAPIAAHAQSLWLPRDRGSITLEALKPNFKTIDEDFFTGAFFLDLRTPIKEGGWIVAEVPYARVSADYFEVFFGLTHFSEASLGNLYLGIETGGGRYFGEFGVRFPTTPSGNDLIAAQTGASSDFGRFNTFYPKLFSAQGVFNLRLVSPGGISNRGRLGGALAAYTAGGDPELFGIYSWQTGYEGRAVRVGVGASGTVWLTRGAVTGGSIFTNQLEAHADFGAGRIRPGLEAKLPLGDPADVVSVVLGASLSVGLGSE